MNFTKIFSILILSIVFSIAVSACGLCDKIKKAKNAAMVETESPDPGNSISAESDGLLLFMETLTGHKNIVQINGEIDIDNLRDMLKIADSGETDSMGRRYFTYSAPTLRQAPVSISLIRFDIETCIDNAATELKQAYADDIVLIARRVDKLITYVVNIDEEDNSYEYGVFYIFSAIPIKAQISPDNTES